MTTKNDIRTDIKNSAPDLAPGATLPSGMVHNLALPLDGSTSLARLQNYIGQYVCVHSAPSAWFGCMVDVSIDGGVVSCDLADAGLWTQGATKDLLRPGKKATADLEARRDGVVTVAAITALQPSAAFTEGDDKVQDAPRLRKTRVRSPREMHIGLEDYAAFSGASAPHEAAGAILEVYEKLGTKKEDNGRGNFKGLLQMVKPYADTKDFPWRAVASILLHEARSYLW